VPGREPAPGFLARAAVSNRHKDKMGGKKGGGGNRFWQDRRCRRGQAQGQRYFRVVEDVRASTLNAFVGTFRKVSKKYLHLHVAEFQLRYNYLHNDDIFGTEFGGC
jgi:hypothetical protein